MLWIPPGFGHAFLVLEDNTDFLYKTTDFYAPECEAAVAWNDPSTGIQWPEGFTEDNLRLSEKDRRATQLRSAKVFD
jgi:dTDP-4-dehydrorhamnose 3,5-epimerase